MQHDLQVWMDEHEYESIQQMQGSMSRKSVPQSGGLRARQLHEGAQQLYAGNAGKVDGNRGKPKGQAAKPAPFLFARFVAVHCCSTSTPPSQPVAILDDENA